MLSMIRAALAPYVHYVYAVLIAAIVAGFMLFIHHERMIGEQRILNADAKARLDEERKNAQITAALAARAAKAEGDRDAAQKMLDDYLTSHPVPPVRVCHPTDSGRGLPPATGANTGSGSAGTGPAPVPEVPAGSDGPDIGPALAIIVRAAGTMAGLYQQFQQAEVK